MSLYREGSSEFWWCRFKVNGKTIRRSTGKTDKREAQVEEGRLRAEFRDQAQSRRRGVAPLADFCTLDIERAVREGANEKESAPTLTAIWTPLIQHFGDDYDIGSLELLAMERYIDARRKWPKKNRKTGEITYRRIAGQTIRREIAALRRACVIAKKRGWIRAMPDEFPRLKKDPKNAAMKGKLRHPDVLRQLLADANDRRLHGTEDATVRDHLMFCVLTGLRAEELQKVHASWLEDAPPDDDEVIAYLRLPDTETARLLGVPKEAEDILTRRKEAVKLRSDGLLFPHKSIGQWLRRYSAKKGLSPAVTLRDLRHTYSTLAMKGTSDAVAVQEAMGHTDLATTQIYQSATIDRVTKVGVAVARAIFGPQSDTRKAKKRSKGARPKVSDPEDVPAKSLILQHARLAQLDRALVSEADLFANFLEFLAAKQARNVQENAQRCQIKVSDTGVRPDVRVMCAECDREAEVQDGPGSENCVFCGGKALPVLEPLPEERV